MVIKVFEKAGKLYSKRAYLKARKEGLGIRRALDFAFLGKATKKFKDSFK